MGLTRYVTFFGIFAAILLVFPASIVADEGVTDEEGSSGVYQPGLLKEVMSREGVAAEERSGQENIETEEEHIRNTKQQERIKEIQREKEDTLKYEKYEGYEKGYYRP